MLATAVFVGGHFALSSISIRVPLVRSLGEGPFRAFYSLFALAALVWTVMAYNAAPYIELWPASPAFTHIPYLLMPFASVLAVAGLTTRTVTTVGGEAMKDNPRLVSGIVTVTRHPFLWAVLLWSGGHLAANGDVASLVFFGGFAVLSIGGMAHIDYRRRMTMGPQWGPIAMTTSAVPFRAALEGRRPVDWRGIGWARLVGGLVLFMVLPFLHPWIAGVAILAQ